MSKDKIYTLTAFSLSFSIVFGGWFLIKNLLNQRAVEFLNGAGQIALQSSEVALFSGSEPKDILEGVSGQGNFKGEALSEDMMEKVLTIWENGGRELPHEPKKRQMKMEQAITAGRNWIVVLAEKKILPSYLGECSFDKTNAKLCALDVEVSFDDALMSFWEITYIGSDVKIILTIHAVSGQVWKADISMNGDKMIYGACSEEELLEIAFPIMIGENDETMKVNQAIYKSFPEGRVYAAVKRDQIAVDKQKPAERLLLWLCTAPEN